MRTKRAVALFLMALVLSSPACRGCCAQAAMLMEAFFGFFGFLNPTGHDAVFFERICAEAPVRLRRCAPGELGAVITRYQGIARYDWIAMPLLPYLYSVESSSEVPARTDCQGRSKRKPIWRSKREPVRGRITRVFGGESALERSGRGLSPPRRDRGVSVRWADSFCGDFA